MQLDEALIMGVLNNISLSNWDGTGYLYTVNQEPSSIEDGIEQKRSYQTFKADPFGILATFTPYLSTLYLVDWKNSSFGACLDVKITRGYLSLSSTIVIDALVLQSDSPVALVMEIQLYLEIQKYYDEESEVPCKICCLLCSSWLMNRKPSRRQNRIWLYFWE